MPETNAGSADKISNFQTISGIAPGSASLERLLADARKHLFETGTRNRLVHTPRGSKRFRSISIVEADSIGIFDLLVRHGRALRFLPAAPPKGDEPAAPVAPAEPAPAGGNPAAAVTSPAEAAVRPTPRPLLQTQLEPELLEKKLLGLYRDARTAEEEQGINILFLALGFLHWYEDDKSEVRRAAPLILIPVDLIRDVRRSTFELRLRDEDMTTNQAIQERLRTDFEIALPDLPDGDEWTPDDYLKAVAEAVAIKPRWSVDANGAELGFYSFSKLLMIRDLDPANWPERSILGHPLMRGLLSDGFAQESAFFPADAKLDTLFEPQDLVHVVDADASQTLVIETIRKGRNLVVQGPPGTGKSQTITNIIASAVHDGKTVLFVAEKMAALSVVHDRLRKAGLGQICLELHSRTAAKRAVLAELETTLESIRGAAENAQELQRLKDVRGQLNEVAARLHAPLEGCGLTPYQLLAHLVAAREQSIASYVPLLPEASGWTGQQFSTVNIAARALAEQTLEAGPLSSHPLYGVRATGLQPAEVERLPTPLRELEMAAKAHDEVLAPLASYLGAKAPNSLQLGQELHGIFAALSKLDPGAADLLTSIDPQHATRLLHIADIGLQLAAMKQKYADIFRDAAFTMQLQPIREGLMRGLSIFSFFSFKYRGASKVLASLLKTPLPANAQERIALLDELFTIQKLSGEIAAEHQPMSSLLGLHWNGERSDFQMLKHVAVALQAIAAAPFTVERANAAEIARKNLSQDYASAIMQSDARLRAAADAVIAHLDPDFSRIFAAAGIDHAPLNALAERAALWQSALGRFDQYRRLYSAEANLRALSPVLADALVDGSMKAGDAPSVIACTWHEAQWGRAVRAMPQLQEFHGAAHDRTVSEFGDLERRRRVINAGLVRARHEAEMPRGALGAIGIIRSEIKKKRAYLPIRQLIARTGETFQRIKPVLLMSPISVSQFLPPGTMTFDLLVIDEASQVRPEDALGLVARCRQIAVVGDSKQLPPTAFFDRVVADSEADEDDEETETTPLAPAKVSAMESILSLCEARGLSADMLRWHYRSRHPSLIEVSNAEFYRRLVMPPAPSAERGREGLILRRVQVIYDRGGKRTNVIEAEAIADAVAAHARECPQLSLGIATFSTAQRDAITDILDRRRRDDDVLDAFLREGKSEDVFVKNLENVQGDERDVIMISVGYGPRTAGGRLDSMVFGPVSAEGGERRLNVLFTRARSRCEIFVSFPAGDIDTSRARGEGPRVLKRFLQFAETGVLEEARQTGGESESIFEDAVAAVIERLGYSVDKQVGSAGFRIDLAVRHPRESGRYMLAVECDGATYHSALWARERDRLRQSVLENLGWRFLRLWSTDWFYRPAESRAALKAALDAAAQELPATPPAVTAQPAAPATVSSPEAMPELQIVQPVVASDVPAYRVADIMTSTDVEPQDVHVAQMAAIATSIVECEGPVHEEEVARRIATLFGKSRAGSQIMAASANALRHAGQSGALVKDEEFWMTPTQRDKPPVRNRAEAPASLQRADMFSPLELRAAARLVEKDNGEMPEDERLLAIARVLGFKRTGPELRAAILAALYK